jgi:septum formation topological specificity factor MinE
VTAAVRAHPTRTVTSRSSKTAAVVKKRLRRIIEEDRELLERVAK